LRERENAEGKLIDVLRGLVKDPVINRIFESFEKEKEVFGEDRRQMENKVVVDINEFSCSLKKVSKNPTISQLIDLVGYPYEEFCEFPYLVRGRVLLGFALGFYLWDEAKKTSPHLGLTIINRSAYFEKAKRLVVELFFEEYDKANNRFRESVEKSESVKKIKRLSRSVCDSADLERAREVWKHLHSYIASAIPYIGTMGIQDIKKIEISYHNKELRLWINGHGPHRIKGERADVIFKILTKCVNRDNDEGCDLDELGLGQRRSKGGRGYDIHKLVDPINNGIFKYFARFGIIAYPLFQKLDKGFSVNVNSDYAFLIEKLI
jgi:hypothetical protein